MGNYGEKRNNDVRVDYDLKTTFVHIAQNIQEYSVFYPVFILYTAYFLNMIVYWTFLFRNNLLPSLVLCSRNDKPWIKKVK